MKGLVCLLLLLETFVLVVPQQVNVELNENEISQQLSSDDRRKNPSQTDTLRDEASTGFPDIYASLRELNATVTEQNKNIRALETRLSDAEQAAEQQTFILEELSKKFDETSSLTLSQVEELGKENRDRQIAFSAGLTQSGEAYTGPFTTDITLTFRNIHTNIGNAYNPNTGIFTAPVKGAYMFRFSIHGHGGIQATASIAKNGQQVVIAHATQAQGDLNSSNGVVLILEVGDAVYVRLQAGRRLFDNWYSHCTFSGFLLFTLRED